MPMVASKTAILPRFSIIPLRHAQGHTRLEEFLRRLGLLKSWGFSNQGAGGRARYVQWPVPNIC